MHKKSVSFSDSAATPAVDGPSYSVVFSPKLFPVHLVLSAYTLFNSDLSPEKVLPLLSFQLTLLIASQLLYAVVFNSSISESRKGRLRQLKFNVLREYNILFIALLICSIAVIPLYVAIVLFGAPFTSYFYETLYLAAHISALCFPVVVGMLKSGRQTPLFYNYLAAVAVGAWIGAIAIPLDWDRPWQNWPMPIVGGAYGGAVVGYTFGGFL